MNQKPKRRLLVLSSLALVGATTLATSFALMNNYQDQPTKDPLVSSINQRNITDNITNTEKIENPDEVFYTGVKLSEQDVWQPGGATTPYATGNIDQSKKEHFDNLRENLEKLQNTTGGSSEAVTQLMQISGEVDKYIDYKTLESQWSTGGFDDILTWDQVKDVIKGQLGNPAEEFNQINGLDTVDKYLLQLSGITPEDEPVEKILKLSSKTITKRDLVKKNNSSNPFLNQPGTRADVSDVAGTDYKTLVKIGEIDLNEQQNYVLEYSYSDNVTSAPAKSHLIIKNDKGQIQKAETLKEAYQNLDIFGRYDALSSNSSLGQGSFKEEQENIVLRRTDSNNRAGDKNTLEILVRLKTGESINNISFSPEYAKPKKFGILDVQADDKTTFKKIIETNKETETGSGTLLMNKVTNNQNTDDQLVKIQFFTSEYIAKRKTSAPAPYADANAEANRTIEIYQGYEPDNSEFEFSADLNYIVRYSDGAGGNDSGNDYEPIKEYVGGVATNKVVSLNLKFDGENPSEINEGKSTYNFFALLKDNIAEDIKPLFPDISEIKATSEVKNKIAKQTIEYSDKFYLVGNAAKLGVDTKRDIKNKIPNMLDKIFPEKPKVWDETITNPAPPFRSKRDVITKANPKKESTLKASEQIDEKVNVIKSLAAIYKKWSTNDSDFAQKTFSFETAQVSFKPSGGWYRDISIERKAFNGNGFNLYTQLTAYWDELARMIDSVFNNGFSQNQGRYTINTNNSEQTIVAKFFVNNFEFIPNYSKVDALIAEGIQIWNDDPANKPDTSGNVTTPSFDSLSSTTKDKFANILASLVQIQFDAIVKEFEANQMHPLYNEFKTVLSSQDKINRSVVADSTQLFDTVKSDGLTLIKYKDQAWNSIYSSQQVTVKEQLLSLVKLLTYGQSDDDATALSDAILTNPIVALKFKEFNPESLVDFTDSQSLSTKLNQMRIIDGILTYFGYSFTDSYTDFINNLTPLKLVFKYNGKPTNMNFAQVLEDIIHKLGQKDNEYRPTANESYSSYWLDNIIAGTNVIRSMNWKLKQLNGVLPPTSPPTPGEPGEPGGDGGTETPDGPATYAARATEGQWEPQEVIAKIRDILAQQQGSPAEQAAWFSAMTNGSKNFDVFASQFSGRNGADSIEKIFNELTKDSVIMERRTTDYNEGYLASLSESLKYIWFILVALIGVGIMSSSIVGITNKARQEKLSAHPIIKWLLFSLIGLGALMAILALGFGIPAIL